MSMKELREAIAAANEMSRRLAEVSAQQQRLIEQNEKMLQANDDIIAVTKEAVDQAFALNDLIRMHLPVEQL